MADTQSSTTGGDVPEPPESLKKHGKRFYTEIVTNYVLEPAALTILEQACLMLDRVESCRDRIRRDGLTLENAHGQTIAHPLLVQERQFQKGFDGLVKGLKLPSNDDEPEPTLREKQIKKQREGKKGGRPRADAGTTPSKKRPVNAKNP